MRYAQARAKQKLHLVAETDPDLTGSQVSSVALCGRHGPWGITINVSLGMPICTRCLRVWKRMRARR